MTLRPTFYLIGFPKCGTTSIAAYLAENPQVCFSDHKEPHYQATDFTDPVVRRVTTEADYQKQFHFAGSQAPSAVGEGSTGYIYSKTAVSNCLEYSDDPKFVVVVRNPVDMTASIHAQMLGSGHEDVEDLAQAWELSPQRAEGKNLPMKCPEPIFVTYQDFARLGHFLELALLQIPRERLKIVVFEEFMQQPREQYRELLDWLGIPDDNRIEFDVRNARGYHRNRALGNLINNPPGFLLGAAERAKRLMGAQRLNVIDRLRRWNFRHEVRAMNPDLRQRIAQHYAPEVQRLESILGRSLADMGYQAE